MTKPRDIRKVSGFSPAIVAAALAWLALGMPTSLTPQPPAPTPESVVVDLDLRPAFAAESNRSKARHDAHLLAHVTNWIADYLEADGVRESPRYTEGGQIEDLRVEACWWATAGRTFGGRYPTLGPTLGEHLEGAVGHEAADLDPTVRAQWVRAFREISAASIQAAQ